MNMIIIDPRTSGAAGDLLIAGLLSLQGESYFSDFCQLFQRILKDIDPSFNVEAQSIKKSGFSGIQLSTTAEKRFSQQEMHTIIEKLSKQLRLSSESAELANLSLSYLIQAEKNVHGEEKKYSEIQFHELATTDTIFDILGFAYLWDHLKCSEKAIFILPIALGSGFVSIEHGTVTIPAPATTEIIRKGDLVVRGGPIEGELLTPTGAAILASMKATPINDIPLMKINRIGRSFGTREYKGKIVPQLQIIEGEQVNTHQEDINILETNVDDVDGEIVGYLFEKLIENEIVLDLTIINTLTKKNRPGFLIRAVVSPENTNHAIKLMIQELGTLGVRVLPAYRHIVPRKEISYQVKVFDETEEVRLKRGFLGPEMISEKIEFEDLRRIAQNKKLSVRETKKRITAEIQKEIRELDENNA